MRTTVFVSSKVVAKRHSSGQGGAMLAEPPATLLSDASLFLDFDGTLVELAPSPDSIEVGGGLTSLLERLGARLHGRLAILTGRSVRDVRSYLHPAGLAVAGSHGLEHAELGQDPGAVERPASLNGVIEQLRLLQAAHPGVLVEEKPLGVALHFRQAPHAEDLCRTAAEQAAAQTGLEVQPGKLVFELKPGGADKGRALYRFMQQPPFAGTRPIFLGDDLTDEHGFSAAHALGGAGVLVGDERPTEALYRLPDVGSVMRWLNEAAEALA
jgi:trehalose 6-phosphate phosphatase